ncbi:MAG TPA: NmrA family NAD(P)-binding protein [Anaerolineales bacterium]|nr:NmrA family NAD(P)-binding protein [Anaerolineales bacterium]
MILVTGASGKTGQAVVRALARAGAPVRALVRDLSRSDELTTLGAREVLAADMRVEAEMRPVFAGTQAVYHIGPNVHPQELEIGLVALNAARQAGVGHFVLHSVLHPQTEQMPHHWHKLRMEEALLESGLAFTVLQPTAYMQNLLVQWHQITEQGLVRNPYPVETRLSLVDLADVAEVAAVVLTHDGHKGATYELVGTQPLSQTEAAEILGKALGIAVRAEAESIADWDIRAAAAGLAEPRRAILIKMFEYYARHGLVGNPKTLGWLLGREPSSLATFARRAAGRIR